MTTPEMDPEKIAEEAAAKAPSRAPKAKVLGITEKKQIEKYINSDYDLLIADLNQYKTELVRAKTLEVNEQYANMEDTARQFQEEWARMRQRFADEVAEFRGRVREAGMNASTRGFGRDSMVTTSAVDFEITGKNEALKQVESEVRYVIERARHALERKRGETLRALIMSGGVPDEAKQLVASLPTAQEVLLAAMQERPGSMRLLLGAAMQEQQGQVVIQQDGDTVEGLVIHDETDYRQGVQQ